MNLLLKSDKTIETFKYSQNLINNMSKLGKLEQKLKAEGRLTNGIVLAPNHQPSILFQNLITEQDEEQALKTYLRVHSNEFKEWFGDWENHPKPKKGLLDPWTNEPLIVYHGTDSEENITQFNFSKKSTFGFKEHGAVYFTSLKEDAQKRGSGIKTSMKAKQIIPAFIRMKNPAEVGDVEKNEIYEDMLEAGEKEVKELIKRYNHIWKQNDWNYEIKENGICLLKPQKRIYSGIKQGEEIIISREGNLNYIGDIKKEESNLLRQKGIDGIQLLKDKEHGLQTIKNWYIVLNANQIKSIYNNGEFKSSSDNIFE